MSVTMGSGGAAPGFLARYLFYTRARIPRGHEEWARGRLSFGRWLAALLLIEACVWFLLALFVVAVSGHFRNLQVVFWLAVFAAAIAPFSAGHYLAKARRRLDV